MLMHELLAMRRALLDATALPPFLHEWLSDSEEYRSDILTRVGLYVPNQSAENANALTSTVSSSVVQLRQLHPSLTFKALHSAESDVLNLMESMPPESRKPFENLLSAIEEFDEAFSDWLGKNDVATGVHALDVGADLFRELEAVRGGISALVKSPEELAPLSAGEEVLTLELAGEHTISNISQILHGIQESYSALSHLADVSEAEYPLRVLRLETGSLWVQIAGNKTVIGALATFIGSTAKFLFDRFRSTGKVPKGTEQLKTLLEIRERMAAHGLNTTLADQELEAVYVKLARNLARIVGAAPQVEVNGEVISVSKELEERYLAESKPLLLEAKTEDQQPGA